MTYAFAPRRNRAPLPDDHPDMDFVDETAAPVERREPSNPEQKVAK